MSENFIGAIDQGTSSSRFLVFSAKDYRLVTSHQVELKLITEKGAGWVEMDPQEILNSVLECIENVAQSLQSLSFSVDMIKAIGLTTQRCTTIIWDKVTGKPLYNAIVWSDGRTQPIVDQLMVKCNQNPFHFRDQCGLPLCAYFSALKIKWLIENVPEVKEAVDENRCAFGTVDSWLIWNLTGKKSNHFTDVTNAAATMLMNLKTLDWDESLCEFFNVPKSILPKIKNSSENYGAINDGALKGVPLTAVLGDQNAALVGHLCFEKGSAKNSYGTGCFLLYNTGNDIVYSSYGLITTVAYKFENEKPVYALEGSVGFAGAAVNWLKDNLKMISEPKESEQISNTIQDSEDVIFVPAFSGLSAPHWRPDARGLIIGLSQFTTKAHVVRATLEAVAFQNLEILEVMNKDSGVELKELQVSGGMTKNELLMQIQADLLGIPVCNYIFLK